MSASGRTPGRSGGSVAAGYLILQLIKKDAFLNEL
jgi:hypothetical protein